MLLYARVYRFLASAWCAYIRHEREVTNSALERSTNDVRLGKCLDEEWDYDFIQNYGHQVLSGHR